MEIVVKNPLRETEVSPRKRKTHQTKNNKKQKKQTKQTNRTSYPLPHAFMSDTIMHNLAQETSTIKA